MYSTSFFIRSKDLQNTCKSGFTLLETLISVALLLILILIVDWGFVSTMKFSANTSAFEKAGNKADSQANAVLSKTASLTANGTGTVVLTDLSGKVILFPDSSGTPVPTIRPLPITKYSATPVPPINYDFGPYAAAHRNVFIYKP